MFKFSSYEAFLNLSYSPNLQIKATENKTGSDNVSSVSVFVNSGALWVRKFGKLSTREDLVMT